MIEDLVDVRCHREVGFYHHAEVSNSGRRFTSTSPMLKEPSSIWWIRREVAHHKNSGRNFAHLPQNYRYQLYLMNIQVILMLYLFLKNQSVCLLSQVPWRSLRSSADDRRLDDHLTRTNIGARAFRCVAPTIWNALPLDIRDSPSASVFKSKLKAHYFRLAFS